MSLSCVQLFAIPWIQARQASLSSTNSWSSLRLTSIESVMPSSHLILCRPLLLLPPIPPSNWTTPLGTTQIILSMRLVLLKASALRQPPDTKGCYPRLGVWPQKRWREEIIFPFSNESTLRMRWPKYWSFSFSIIPSKEIPGLISFRMDGWISLQSKGLSRVFSNITVQKHQFFSAQLSSQSNSHIHT